MEILLIGGGVILLVFWLTGDRVYESTIEQMEEEPAGAGWSALFGALAIIALFGVAAVAISMMAIAAGGTW
jgi:hypothetical protein